LIAARHQGWDMEEELMARPVRTAVAPNPLRPVKSHLIEEYNARTNIVRCDCGWSGNADEFAVHRRAVGAASPS
jgi:hypothetical protein